MRALPRKNRTFSKEICLADKNNRTRFE